MNSIWVELKRRNVVRVAIAYAVVCWLLLQVADVVLNNIAAPDWVFKAILLLLVIGFPVAIIFAWAFELTPEGLKKEKDVDRTQSITATTGRKIDFIIIAVLAIIIVFLIGNNWLTEDSESSDTEAIAVTNSQPLVVVMDSHVRSTIYDDETAAAGGTNADVVSDILLDLPIKRQKEAVSPSWRRDEEILGFGPNLIVIHWSAFREEGVFGPRSRLRLLIEYFAKTETQFLIYSRQPEEELRAALAELLAELDQEHPGLLSRIHPFGLTDYGDPRWLDPKTAASLKLRVKTILGID
jgi:hypothetical protein